MRRVLATSLLPLVALGLGLGSLACQPASDENLEEIHQELHEGEPGEAVIQETGQVGEGPNEPEALEVPANVTPPAVVETDTIVVTPGPTPTPTPIAP